MRSSRLDKDLLTEVAESPKIILYPNLDVRNTPLQVHNRGQYRILPRPSVLRKGSFVISS